MPIAIEAVVRIDALFAIEREINGLTAAARMAARLLRSKPLVDDFEQWLRGERKKLSPKGPLAKAIDYTFNHWKAFTRFLDDGRICLSNNAAERSIRGIAVGRRNWTFCGSDTGGHRAAVMFTLIETALCRARHSAVYAARRTMPSGSVMSHGCHAVVVGRAGGGSVPFGIVRSLTVHRGRRAGGRSAGSGPACRARTA
jgi:transposase